MKIRGTESGFKFNIGAEKKVFVSLSLLAQSNFKLINTVKGRPGKNRVVENQLKR